ncbi:hypothetical protein [Aeromicrobium sp. CTD01-1L150]|uniref:hypothetical protein n=1 Tax=Aeromicrobium sp. CTD01-1L150 TaxID=3341830 RepID=UPI0035C04CA6
MSAHTAREAARQHDGRFGIQPHADDELDLTEPTPRAGRRFADEIPDGLWSDDFLVALQRRLDGTPDPQEREAIHQSFLAETERKSRARLARSLVDRVRSIDMHSEAGRRDLDQALPHLSADRRAELAESLAGIQRDIDEIDAFDENRDNEMVIDGGRVTDFRELPSRLAMVSYAEFSSSHPAAGHDDVEAMHQYRDELVGRYDDRARALALLAVNAELAAADGHSP